jgi:hypothetical protein
MKLVVLKFKDMYIINKIRLFLDFKGPRLQKEMEPSALALKGTVTHGSQKYKYLLAWPKSRGYSILFKKG